MTPREFALDYIRTWEGGLSVDPVDPGNWTSGQRGAGLLAGSNFGVTPAALAAHRNVKAETITRAIMAALAIDEAADIALASYYTAPGLDLLPWNRITASVMDFGWGAGPQQAVKTLQGMIGATRDGNIGPKTVAAYSSWLEQDAAMAFAAQRNAFYDSIIATDPAKAKYRNGWRNRTAYFTPASKWWSAFS